MRLTCGCNTPAVFFRVQSVIIPSILYGGWLTAAKVMAPHASLPGTGFLTVPLAVAGLIRLWGDRQLRSTLTEIFRHAPGGSVIDIRNRGLGGSVRIQVGPGRRPRRSELT